MGEERLRLNWHSGSSEHIYRLEETACKGVEPSVSRYILCPLSYMQIPYRTAKLLDPGIRMIRSKMADRICSRTPLKKGKLRVIISGHAPHPKSLHKGHR